jgi:hypothetical protein
MTRQDNTAQNKTRQDKGITNHKKGKTQAIIKTRQDNRQSQDKTRHKTKQKTTKYNTRQQKTSQDKPRQGNHKTRQNDKTRQIMQTSPNLGSERTHFLAPSRL